MKRKCVNTLIQKLSERLILFYRAYNKNEEDKYSGREFYCP